MRTAATSILLLAASVASAEVQIPAQADWTDHGAILRATKRSGDWNREFAGFAPCGVVKRGGRYYLYYIASDGDRGADGGPRHRALGVASCRVRKGCTKRSHWKDNRDNPVLRHLPSIAVGGEWGEEEGIFTCAVARQGRRIHLYYGAMTNAGSPESVVDDVKVVTSKDPLAFPDGLSGATVLDHADPQVWGSGDEIDPLGVWRSGSVWSLYYSVGSGFNPPVLWGLGLATGPDFDTMTSTQGLINGQVAVQGGMDGSNRVSPTHRALFMDQPVGSEGSPQQAVYLVSDESPSDLGEPVATYTFRKVRHQVTFLDERRGRWLMFYRNHGFDKQWKTGGAIRLKTAPVVGISGTR
jgi:hypothetical protein